MKIYNFLFGLLVMTSCVGLENPSVPTTVEAEQLQRIGSGPQGHHQESHAVSIDQLTNKVFDYGSKTHLTDTCSFYFECDCCSAELMFFKDNSFYMLDYCESDVTLTHGTFEISPTHVDLHFSGHSTTKAYNWEYEAGNSTIPYVFKDTTTAAQSFRFNSLLCNNKVFLEAGSEALIEADKDPQELIGKIEQVKGGKE